MSTHATTPPIAHGEQWNRLDGFLNHARACRGKNLCRSAPCVGGECRVYALAFRLAARLATDGDAVYRLLLDFLQTDAPALSVTPSTEAVLRVERITSSGRSLRALQARMDACAASDPSVRLFIGKSVELLGLWHELVQTRGRAAKDQYLNARDAERDAAEAAAAAGRRGARPT